MATRKSTHYGPQHFADEVTFAAGKVTLPTSSVSNSAVSAGAGIDASKVNHQYTVDRQLYAPGTTVAAITQLLKIVRGATGTLIDFEAAVTTAPTGDYTITVALQKSTAGGAFATVLSADIVFNASSVARVVQTATINSADLVAGDILQVVVTVAGTTGAQGAGLVISLTQIETPA